MTSPRSPGETLTSGYTVHDHLSRGHVLDVYSVWSTERDCLCIAKVLLPDRITDTASRDSLLREGRLLTELTHPHLVRGYDVIAVDESAGPIVVMETLTGMTLSRLIETDAPNGLGTRDAALLGLQLASALRYLHGHNLIHLDLKPSNIVCSGGKAVLLDLSLAGSPGPSTPGAGTAEYMAPEQVTGGRVGPPADIWGLGGVLYRALTSHRPFPRSTDQRPSGHAVDLAPLDNADVDLEVKDLVSRCLAPPPTERPSIETVRTTLTKILESEQAGDTPSANPLSSTEGRERSLCGI